MAVKYSGASGINSYPVLPVEGIRQQIVELIAANKSIATSRAAAKLLVDKKFYSAEHFFLGQYGMSPFESMITEHLYDATKKYKHIKSGTPKATEIATTILAYRNPAPPQQLSRENVMLIVSGLIAYEETTNIIKANEAKIVQLGMQSMMKLEPPMPEQLLAIAKAGTLANTLKTANSATDPVNWTERGTLLDLSKYNAVTATKTLTKVLQPLGYRPVGKDYIRSDGLLLTPYLIYNMKSIAGQGGAVGYWSNAARYRLAAMPISESITEVHLVEVNPTTGAPYRRGKVVARVNTNASDALATVRKSYPYVDELKSEVNPVLDKGINVNHATSGLNEKAEKWKLIGDKGARYFVNVLETTWIWSDIDLQANPTWYTNFKSGRHTANGRNHTQQLLLNFTSDDPKARMASIMKGNPPKTLNHLLYGGSASQMRNCFPVSISKFYLLPTGVEEALERFCLDRGDNVLAAHVKRKLGGTKSAPGSKYNMVSDMTQARFNSVLVEINKDIEVLLAALTSPYLLTHGVDYVLTGNSSERLGKSFTQAQRSKIGHLFKAAKWPSSKPELMFEAPINDSQDSQKVYGDFVKAMKATGGVAPPELASAEMPEFKIQSTPQIVNGKELMCWQIDAGLGYPFNAKVNTTRSFMTYSNNGTRWQTKFAMRELLHTKGITTRTRVKGESAAQVTSSLYEEPENASQVTASYSIGNAEIAAVGGIMGLVGIGAFYGVMRHNNKI